MGSRACHQRSSRTWKSAWQFIVSVAFLQYFHRYCSLMFGHTTYTHNYAIFKGVVDEIKMQVRHQLRHQKWIETMPRFGGKVRVSSRVQLHLLENDMEVLAHIQAKLRAAQTPPNADVTVRDFPPYMHCFYSMSLISTVSTLKRSKTFDNSTR